MYVYVNEVGSGGISIKISFPKQVGKHSVVFLNKLERKEPRLLRVKIALCNSLHYYSSGHLLLLQTFLRRETLHLKKEGFLGGPVKLG